MDSPGRAQLTIPCSRARRLDKPALWVCAVLLGVLAVASITKAEPVRILAEGPGVSMGQGFALLLRNKCVVVTARHVATQEIHFEGETKTELTWYDKITVFGSGGVTGLAKGSRYFPGDRDQDFAILEFLKGENEFCVAGEEPIWASESLPMLIYRALGGDLVFVEAKVVGQSGTAYRIRTSDARDAAALRQGVSGSIVRFKDDRIEPSMVVEVTPDGEAYSVKCSELDRLAGQEFVCGLGQRGLSNLADLSKSLDVVEKALKLLPRADIGQNAAVGNLVSAGHSFAGVTLSGLPLARASLRKGNFSEATLEGMDFSGSDLTKGDFHGSGMEFSNLTDAQLEQADFSGAFLAYVKASRANLVQGILERSNWFAADLQGANLVGANLSSASFVMADLRGADLTGADLTNALFIGAIFDETTKLSNVILGNTDVSLAIGVPQAFYTAGKGDLCNTPLQEHRTGILYNLSIIEKIPNSKFSGGIEYRPLETHYISPSLPDTLRQVNLVECSERAEDQLPASLPPIYNGRLYGDVGFSLPTELLNAGGRRSEYLSRIKEHSKLIKALSGD